MVGVGGVESAETAWDKICAGADLVQVCSGFIFGSLGLPTAINRGLARKLAEARLPDIAAAVGRDTDAWANQPF